MPVQPFIPYQVKSPSHALTWVVGATANKNTGVSPYHTVYLTSGRTCADEEHVVGALVQGDDPVPSQPGEDDPLGEQQGACRGLSRHQRVRPGEDERGVRQLQGAAVAVPPVPVCDALNRGGGERRRGEETQGS